MAGHRCTMANRNVRQFRRLAGGFTLIELVVVIMLVAIIAIVALQRVDVTAANMPAQVDQLARDIRHMQTIAATWSVPLRLTANATGYFVSCISGPTPPCNGVGVIRDPAPRDPSNFQVSWLAGISGSVTTLNIDIQGRPCDAPCTTGANVQIAPTTFTLTGGGRMSTVTVRPLTGHIVVVY